MGKAIADQESLWVKTPVANLVRYKPSGVYFARAKVGGKLIRKTLKTKVLSVAKLKLSDLLKEEHQKQEQKNAVVDGKMTFDDAWKICKQRTEGDPDIKSGTLKYHDEILAAIYKSWPGLNMRDIRKITKTECLDWRARFSKDYSGTRINGAISMVRRVIDIGVEIGLRYDNPAKSMTRAKIRQKQLALPEPEQFEKFLHSIENAGGRTSQSCAYLVRFLAYGGFRKNEAANITWGDCDFVKGEIKVRGDHKTATKNWSVRRVPMIPDMRVLLQQIKEERPNEAVHEAVMGVRECQKAMERAAMEVKMKRITHHDLRHLFATRCIESRVDVPTVSRWLGHKDGGALAMKVYGHLRDQHSVAMAQKVTFSPQRPPPTAST